MNPTQPRPDDSAPYTRDDLVRMVLGHKRELIRANLIAILGTMMAVPIPLLIPILVDEVLLHQPGPAVALMNRLFPAAWHGPVLYIAGVLLLTMFMRIGALGLAVWQSRQFTRISKDVIYQVRRRLLDRLERVSMAEYETLGPGVVASHLVTDLDTIDTFLGTATSRLLVASLTLTGVAIVLMIAHWQLALFILLLNPLVIWATFLLGRRVKELKSKENRAYQGFQGALGETLEAIQQIRASNRERHFIAQIVDKARDIRDYSTAFTWRSDAAQRLSMGVFQFGFDVFRGLSMLMVVYSDLSIGLMLAFFSYLWFMMAPVQEIFSIQYAYAGARAALERINRMIRMDLEPAYPHEVDPFAGRTTTSLTLRNVCFRYGDGPRVLDDVTLEVAAGEKVALVGASGGGKTTLVQVVLGLYPPESGEVLFDGVPVRRIGMDRVREHVATVLQHPALFNDSVRMNLTLGREIEEPRLWQALAVAQLADTVEELPQGLETMLGRNGVRLSGGQRQRLAVARMVLADPRIVILDEATSALDTTTEGRLHQALREFLKGRTTLIIAHRLSAVKQADRALVFENGRIVEQGAHHELMQSGGLYASLYARQEA